MRKYLASFVFLFLIASSLFSQQELGTYFFSGLHQSASLNPAFDADQQFVIGLPSYFGTFHQRGLSVNSLVAGQILDLVGSRRNQMLVGSELSAIRASYKSGDFRYSFAQNYKLFSDLQYSNPVVQLLLNGNASLIGGSAQASPNWNFSTFSETVLGVSYHGYGPLSFGVNAKFINGIQNISTERSDFELSVNDDVYQLELESDLLINSSFPIDFNNLLETNLLSFELFPNNYGVAFDFGLQYESKLFSVSASLLDVGYLTWKNETNNYELDGKFVYEGASFSDVIEGNFNFLDTVGGFLNLETTRNPYNNYIPAKFYANFNYNYSPNVSLGVVTYGHSSYGRMNGAIALNAQRKWSDKHALGLQYGIVGSNIVNLGLSGYTSLGPVQLYGIFDNVVGFFNPLGAENINGRVGINLIFGTKKKTDIRV